VRPGAAYLGLAVAVAGDAGVTRRFVGVFQSASGGRNRGIQVRRRPRRRRRRGPAYQGPGARNAGVFAIAGVL
jgi:hypothetical protein